MRPRARLAFTGRHEARALDSLCLPVGPDLWLGRTRLTLQTIGGKALGLSAILAARLGTPAAVVLPAQVFESHAEAAHIWSGRDHRRRPDVDAYLPAVRRSMESSELQPDVQAALVKGCADLRAPLAVRSSAVMEDAEDASWAGQFESILGVSHAALPRSVVRCWGSLFSAHAAAYAAVHGFDLRQAAMAVVIQELVTPVWAGVLLSQTDIRKQRTGDSVLIEGVRGLGARLVSGNSRPEVRIEVRLANGSVSERFDAATDSRWGVRLEERSLSNAVAGELVAGARKLEELYDGKRLEVEWARDESVTWFLQVRPVAFA